MAEESKIINLKNIEPVLEKKDTILYCLDDNCLFYTILIHRLSANKDKKAVLLIKKNLNIINVARKAKDIGIFDDVIEAELFFSKRQSNTFEEQDVINFYDEIFQNSGYDLDDFTDICVANDNWEGDINLYFNLIAREYTWLEVTVNSASMGPIWMSDKMKKLVSEYKSLTPMAKYAKAFILQASNKSQELLKGKQYVLWNKDDCVESLTEAALDKIAESYSIDLSEFEKSGMSAKTLLLQNSYGFAVRNTVEFKYPSFYLQNSIGLGPSLAINIAPYPMVASLLDKMAIDFYLPNCRTFYVKNHPNEPALTTEKINSLYEGDFRPFTTMPFELVGKLFKYKGIRFGTVITYTQSHSLDAFECGNQITLGESFCFTWFYYCSIYASLLYSQTCGFKNIYCSAILKEQIEFLARTINYEAEVKALDINRAADVRALRNSLVISNFLDDEKKELISFFKNLDQSNAVCFLNVNLTEKFFAEELYPYFIPVNIRKEKTSQYCFNMQRDEVIWVYSKNRKLRDMALDLTCEKNLHYSGYTMRVTQGNLAAAIDEFINESNKFILKDIQRMLDKQQTVINALLAENEDLSLKVIKNETELDKYINLLNSVKNNYLVALAVRDTPGSILNPAEIDLIKRLGFSKFSSEIWRMYVGVIYKGKVVCDITGEKREDPVSFAAIKDGLCGIDLKVNSMAWRQGNKAEIIINGADYAVNMRGINIVVYDIENNNLIDSVAFDYHTENRVCKHKEN